MKNLKEKSGISLIVLVITIIVMIILAAAIILSISNSGIMDKANKAKTDSDIASLKEYVNVLEAEWELMDTSERNATGKSSKTEYVNAKLQEKGYTSALLMKDGTLYTNLQENTKTALQEGIQIGDTVTGYTVKSNSYTTDGSENVFKASVDSNGLNYWENVNQPQTITSDTSITNWVYMGISKDGKLQMTTVSPVNEMILSGPGGFVNGVNALNTVCEKLYSTSKGTARSMNIDDVNEVLNYSGCKGGFYYATGEDYADLNYVDTNGELTIGEIKSKYSVTSGFMQYTPYGTNINNYKLNDYRISKDSTDIENNDKLKSIVFTNDSNTYWLASSCVNGGFDNGYNVILSGYFNVRFVSNKSVDYVPFYGQYDSLSPVTDPSGSYTRKLKPVVEIDSDVSVTYSSGTLTLN